MQSVLVHEEGINGTFTNIGNRLLCPARIVELFGHSVELPAIPWRQCWCLAIDPTGDTPSYVDHIASSYSDVDYEWRENWEAGLDAAGNGRPMHFSYLIIAAEDFRDGHE